MTYEEAARILARYSKTVNTLSLRTAVEMGADALFKRAAQEKAISYVQAATAGSINDILNQGEIGDNVGKESND